MAKRTLATSWRQFERLSNDYLAGKGTPAETVAKLAKLVDKANAEGIGNSSLVPIFIKPYYNNPVLLKFTMEMGPEGEVPDWFSRFVPALVPGDAPGVVAPGVVEIHPLALFKLLREAAAWGREEMAGDLSEAAFLVRRYRGFLRELSKIGKKDSIYFLFLVVLQRVAFMLEIAHLEKRGGVIEVAEGESYHTMLWAFKELELFLRKTFGLSVRAHYGMSWYESDWITGR